MIQTIRRTIKGMGYLDSCGDHPGTALLIAFILMGGIAGLNQSNDMMGFAKGAGFMSILFGPVYLNGCHDRAVIDENETKEDTLTTGTR